MGYFILFAVIVLTNIALLWVWFLLIKLEDFLYRKARKKVKRKHKFKYANYVLKSIHFKNNRKI